MGWMIRKELDALNFLARTTWWKLMSFMKMGKHSFIIKHGLTMTQVLFFFFFWHNSSRVLLKVLFDCSCPCSLF